MASKKGSHRPPAKKSSKKAPVAYVAVSPSKKKAPAKKAAKKKAPVAYVAVKSPK